MTAPELPKTAIEQLPPELANWSQEDIAWLARLAEPMRPLAIRHGRKLWSLTMQANALQHSLGILGSQGRGNRAIAGAANMISKCYNDAATLALQAIGKSMADFQECRGDIERLIALLDSGVRKAGERVSKGGIVLDS